MCMHMSSHDNAPSCVLVVVAMDVELQAVLRLPLERRQSCGEASEGGGPSIFHQFADGERTVWVVQSGIGPVMGALAAQEAVLSLAPRPELVLSLGVGGALAASLAPGDLVLASRVVKHDTRCGGALMRPGELWLSDPHRDKRDPGFDAPAVRDAPLTHIHTETRRLSRSLLTRPLDAEMPPAPPCSAPPALPQAALAFVRGALRGRVVFREGTLLSGDEFVTAERKAALADCDGGGALMVDMEAAGIVQAATRHSLPWAALRTTADRLRPGAAERCRDVRREAMCMCVTGRPLRPRRGRRGGGLPRGQGARRRERRRRGAARVGRDGPSETRWYIT